MNTGMVAVAGRHPNHIASTKGELMSKCWTDLMTGWKVTRGRCLRDKNGHLLRLLRSRPRAQSQQTDSEDAEPTQPKIVTTLPEGRAVPRRPPPTVPLGTKLQKVEDLGEEAWAGVAGVDRRGSGDTDWTQTLLLSAGDVICLLIFASIGRANHGEALTVGKALQTALPFILGWFAVAPFTGGLSPKKDEDWVSTAATRWILGIPLGIVFRSVSRGYIPETSFVVVSMVATAVFLGGWRALFANVISGSSGSSANSSSRNKRGNPFEFISLLISLVKRW